MYTQPQQVQEVEPGDQTVNEDGCLQQTVWDIILQLASVFSSK